MNSSCVAQSRKVVDRVVLSLTPKDAEMLKMFLNAFVGSFDGPRAVSQRLFGLLKAAGVETAAKGPYFPSNAPTTLRLRSSVYGDDFTSEES